MSEDNLPKLEENNRYDGPQDATMFQSVDFWRGEAERFRNYVAEAAMALHSKSVCPLDMNDEGVKLVEEVWQSLRANKDYANADKLRSALSKITGRKYG